MQNTIDNPKVLPTFSLLGSSDRDARSRAEITEYRACQSVLL